MLYVLYSIALEVIKNQRGGGQNLVLQMPNWHRVCTAMSEITPIGLKNLQICLILVYNEGSYIWMPIARPMCTLATSNEQGSLYTCKIGTCHERACPIVWLILLVFWWNANYINFLNQWCKPHLSVHDGLEMRAQQRFLSQNHNDLGCFMKNFAAN